MIHRIAAQLIKNDFNKQKAIVVMGARQVGKTTMLKNLVDVEDCLMLNCDNIDDRSDLENKTTSELRNLVGNHKTVVIDEAQRVHNIGLTLKMLVDMDLPTQILATGSSSLSLADEINEPATGRLIEHRLFPLSLTEIAASTSPREEQRLLEWRMIYGLYPEVVTHPNDARRILQNLANNYLYRDLLGYKGIKKPDILQKLVRALALQVGSEVSYNELANLVGIDKSTVENYINLLEKCYVVFRLPSYNRNLRNEIKKGKKIYFYDNGIRNALISNFAPLDQRNDTGALWENLMVSERVKRNSYAQNYAQMYFWRTQQQQEIDLIEELDGKLTAYEFKWKKAKARLPKTFDDNYPNTTLQVVTPENFWEFV